MSDENITRQSYLTLIEANERCELGMKYPRFCKDEDCQFHI